MIDSPSSPQFLSPADVRAIGASHGARPHIEVAGRVCLLNARIRRCFPLTSPSTHIAIFDAEGNDFGIIPDLDALEADSRAVVDAELDAFYFTPAIERIRSLKLEASMWRWEVDTQRGVATFYLRGVRDSVHEVAPSRWQVFSVDGQRYEIRNLDELDQRSQNLFESLF